MHPSNYLKPTSYLIFLRVISGIFENRFSREPWSRHFLCNIAEKVAYHFEIMDFYTKFVREMDFLTGGLTLDDKLKQVFPDLYTDRVVMPEISNQFRRIVITEMIRKEELRLKKEREI